MRLFLRGFRFWLLISLLFAVIAFAASLMFWLSAPSYAAGAPCHGVPGPASWYGSESGHTTASGQHFDPNGLSAAMPSRSMIGRTVRVTDMQTGRSIVVPVNDYGPRADLGRVIDLSRGAALRLGIINRGVAQVCITPVPRQRDHHVAPRRNSL